MSATGPASVNAGHEPGTSTYGGAPHEIRCCCCDTHTGRCSHWYCFTPCHEPSDSGPPSSTTIPSTTDERSSQERSSARAPRRNPTLKPRSHDQGRTTRNPTLLRWPYGVKLKRYAHRRLPSTVKYHAPLRSKKVWAVESSKKWYRSVPLATLASD